MSVPSTVRARRALPPPLRAALVVGMLYSFLVGVSLLETGISGLGAGFQDGLVREIANPISGLFAGILLTVLVQSSSVSTATIVGLVGAGTLDVSLAVPMIMGANIGTTVTNTLASLGSIRRRDEFQRALTAATMHDFFNLLAVAVLLPLELMTGLLTRVALVLTRLLRGSDVALVPGPSRLRSAVKAPVSLLRDLVAGLGLPGRPGALILLVFGLVLIFLALWLITRNMRQLVRGSVERAMNHIIGRGGGAVGIVIGLLVTVAVQSSSITTSILVPLVAAGLLTARSAYPITLGANVGTTVTALIASLAVSEPAGLTIALVHFLFNVTALAIVFPVRRVREVPVRLAERFARIAVRHPTIVGGYLLGLFVIIPLVGIFLIP
ncbi:MAG: Na/Pi symporter [Actinomycetota bacterium]|nr:Na/Pi symporter [Actinomycetota bacterium]